MHTPTVRSLAATRSNGGIFETRIASRSSFLHSHSRAHLSRRAQPRQQQRQVQVCLRSHFSSSVSLSPFARLARRLISKLTTLATRITTSADASTNIAKLSSGITTTITAKMDVDKVSFYPLLLDIISDISEAHFVAIDLELSGVPSKGSWGKESGKPTIQQRYLEIKEAAERYQILQIGITCVDQNVHDGKYTLKPYNFDLSPVINERGLDIERIFSFQSGAAEFLLGVGFDIGRPFKLGVPYLSRAEAKVAREKFAMRQDKTSMVRTHQIPPSGSDIGGVCESDASCNAASHSLRGLLRDQHVNFEHD